MGRENNDHHCVHVLDVFHTNIITHDKSGQENKIFWPKNTMYCDNYLLYSYVVSLK